MAYKKPIRTAVYVQAYPMHRTRIRIPQPPVRPINIHQDTLIKKDLLTKDPWWMTIHRRGIKRPAYGEDPLEARAVPKDQVKGTLPERIVFKYLTNVLKLVNGIDFDFQSSQSGGRMELGGLVADFLFFYLKIVIQVQGSTHSDYLRMKKDEEQRGILEDMGYRVFDIEESTCYSEPQLEEWMRRVFGLALGAGNAGVFIKSPGMSGGSASYSDPEQQMGSHEAEYEDQILLQSILNGIIKIRDSIYANV